MGLYLFFTGLKRLTLAVSISVSLIGCAPDKQTPEAQKIGAGENVAAKEKIAVEEGTSAGEALFKQHCQECHPRSGRGDYLKRIPVTLLTRKSQYELMVWIEGTDSHREMPSFSHLSSSEREEIADYLLSQITRSVR